MKILYRKNLLFLLILAGIIVSTGCTEQIFEQEKYQPPAWLEGKVFTQIQEQEDLGTFSKCLEKTGYDTILNTSGSYTVFAPTDEAFDEFFLEYQEYKTILDSEETSDKLIKLVEYQILYNAWSKSQLRTLDIIGWVDPDDELNEPRAYKRRTLFYKENKSYPAKRYGNKYRVVREQEADVMKKSYTLSNKFAPIFFSDYLEVYDLQASDYEFYFDRPFRMDQLYFAGAGFEKEGIPAENGFIYKTDKVIFPLFNAEELLEKGYNENSYESFLNLIYDFSELNTNLQATYEQPGADEGLAVDTLYNLIYPELVFNIQSELTGNTNDPRNTYRYHHGLIAPTDQALESFVNTYLSNWGGVEDLPRLLKGIIVNSHMARNPVYLSDIEEGFINGAGDKVFLSRDNFIQIDYGSNCTFLGVDQAIVPRVIKSVARPIYVTRDYNIMMHAVEQTKVLSALKKPEANYAFFLPSDKDISYGGDSSLIRVIDNPILDRSHFETYNMETKKYETLATGDLRKKILNQIASSIPTGIANKEFIENLGGNYIEFNNAEGTARGNSQTTFGYRGDSTISLTPELFPDQTDNGNVYKVQTWFNFNRKTDFYGLFLTEYPDFFSLLQKAGMFDPTHYEFPFMNEGVLYTVFVPSSQAISEYGLDTIPKTELREILKYHFVQGDLIFTDGKKAPGEYPTLSLEESSTATRYNSLTLNPRPDLIEILDRDGNVFLEIPENEGKTNIMIMYDSNEESKSSWDFITTGVVHTIDKVLEKELLRTDPN